MDNNEIILTKTSNGWLIRGRMIDAGRYLSAEEMAVAETPQRLAEFVHAWAKKAMERTP